jgi:hypothetical protein
VGPLATVFDLWTCRLLRLVPDAPCARSRLRHRPSDRAVVATRRGLALVLRRRDLCVSCPDLGEATVDSEVQTPPETPDHWGAFPRLTDEQVNSLATQGERRRTEVGEVLFREGDRDCMRVRCSSSSARRRTLAGSPTNWPWTTTATCARDRTSNDRCRTTAQPTRGGDRCCSRPAGPASSRPVTCAAGRPSGWLRRSEEGAMAIRMVHERVAPQ